MKPRRGAFTSFLAALSYGDAIGNEAIAIQKHLRAAGFESDIFAESVHPGWPTSAAAVRNTRTFRRRRRCAVPFLDRQRGRAA